MKENFIQRDLVENMTILFTNSVIFCVKFIARFEGLDGLQIIV